MVSLDQWGSIESGVDRLHVLPCEHPSLLLNQ